MYFQVSTSTWANDKGCMRVCACGTSQIVRDSQNACVCVHGREPRERKREETRDRETQYKLHILIRSDTTFKLRDSFAPDAVLE